MKRLGSLAAAVVLVAGLALVWQTQGVADTTKASDSPKVVKTDACCKGKSAEECCKTTGDKSACGTSCGDKGGCGDKSTAKSSCGDKGGCSKEKTVAGATTQPASLASATEK
ncbi:MAG TPA: hypothetical protein PLV57_03285, partial [Phycisphaerae bacterium]|nr:hypothetical protein [Phycisphaerae bacterium]